MIHTFPEQEVLVETGGLLGHGAVIHGCAIKKNAMVGINAVVLDGAVVGENSLVGAGALVPAGKETPANKLAAGVPATPTGSPAGNIVELRNVESKIWDKDWHEVFAKIAIYFSKNNSQGGPHGPDLDFKSHARFLIGLGNLPTFSLKKSIPFINNPLQISPEIPNSLSQNLLLLSSPFRSAVNGKGWMSSRANSLLKPLIQQH